jgi:MarR family transcriptional regulator, organic hydroperoxide resistance regulator
LASVFPHSVVEIEHLLRQISTTVRRKGRTLLEQYGITPPQFDALFILDRDGELTIGELSNRLYLAYSTTTDLVDRLERSGFVIRQRDSDDRRVVRVRLQPEGSKLIEQVIDVRRGYLNTVLDTVDGEAQRRILDVLELLNAKMMDR